MVGLRIFWPGDGSLLSVQLGRQGWNCKKIFFLKHVHFVLILEASMYNDNNNSNNIK